MMDNCLDRVKKFVLNINGIKRVVFVLLSDRPHSIVIGCDNRIKTFSKTGVRYRFMISISDKAIPATWASFVFVCVLRLAWIYYHWISDSRIPTKVICLYY